MTANQRITLVFAIIAIVLYLVVMYATGSWSEALVMMVVSLAAAAAIIGAIIWASNGK